MGEIGQTRGGSQLRAENVARSLAIMGRMPTTARIIVWVLGLGLLGVSLYLAPTISVLALALLGLGLPLLVLLWYLPEFGLLAIIFLTSSFVPADIVDLRLPIGGGLDLRDLVLLGMLGLLSLRGLARGRLTVDWWPVGLPLLLFLGFGVFSAAYALFYQGVEVSWALAELRAVLFYALFFVTSWGVTGRRQLAVLLGGLFVIADLTASVVVLRQFAGANSGLLAAIPGADWWASQRHVASAGFGAVRIVPPGHVLMYFMMVIAFCLMVFGHQDRRLRVIAALQFVYLNVGLLLTYTRAQWAAAAVSLGLILLVLIAAYKAQLARYLIIGSAVLLLGYSLFGAQLHERIENMPFLLAVMDRARSIFEPGEAMQSLSMEWRLFEAEESLRSISERPLLGVGLGNAYRDVTTLQGEATGRFTSGSLAAGEGSRFTRFLHSSYLAIAVKMGLPALMCFLWLCAAFLVKGWQLYRRLSKTYLRGIALSVLASYVGLLLWSVFHQHLVQTEGTALVGLMIGLTASIYCMHGREPDTSPAHQRLQSLMADTE